MSAPTKSGHQKSGPAPTVSPNSARFGHDAISSGMARHLRSPTSRNSVIAIVLVGVPLRKRCLTLRGEPPTEVNRGG